MRAAAVVRHRASSPKVLDRVLAETHARKFTVSQSVSQSVISRSRTALTPPPARSPAPPLPALRPQVPSTPSRVTDARDHVCYKVIFGRLTCPSIVRQSHNFY